MTAGPSCQPSPRSPQYDEDLGRQGSYGDEDDEQSEHTLAKKRECASKVAAWITQSAVRITAITSTSTASFDLLDFDLDLEDEQDILDDSDFRYISDGEPYALCSSSCKFGGAPVIHTPTPRRSSRSRSGRRHHGHSQRLRTPSPLYMIKEEDSE
ncbi:hypothetical protein C8R43DRAFT_1029393 [Mycena crocata]|nr:hypothetical protein C8R43DRAFT_1029393 [Mycena crocata]